MTRFRPSTRLFGALVLSGALLSCGGSDGGTPPEDDDPITSVTVAPSTAEIDIDGTTTLTATVRTRDGVNVTSSTSISWTSLQTGVATVAGSGATAVVTGVDDGTATIRASAAGRSGEATITVNDPSPPAAPSSVTAVPFSDTEVDLAWNDESDNEDEFRIEVEELTAGATVGDLPQSSWTVVETVGANTNTYRVRNLDANTTYRFLVRACNANGCTPESGSDGEDDAASGPIDTHPTLVFETTALPSGVVSQSYEATLESTGGTESYDYSVTAGTLPAGLELSAAGVLSGTPTAADEYDVTIEVVSGGQAVARQFTIEVTEEPQPPEITTGSLPAGVVGTPYAAQLEAIKGDGENYTFSVVDGALPGGVNLAATGAFSGTPNTANTFGFTVQVESDGETGTKAFTILIREVLSVATSDLVTGVEGAAYEDQLQATGGAEPYNWELTGGSLPAGLDLDSDGTISGTLTAAGAPTPGGPAAMTTSDFEVTVTSDDGQAATADLSITVYPVLSITTTSLPNGTTGSPYSQTVQATGGDESYTFSLASGGVPPGVNLGSDGSLTGTPTSPGDYTFEVEVDSGDGQTATRELTITIDVGPPTVETTSLPDGEVGSSYSQTLQASGGDGSFTWAIISGSLPSGLDLDTSTGEISGTPDTPGTANFTVEVTSASQTDDQALSIHVDDVVAGPVSLDTDYLIGGNPGVGYSDAVSASGGNGVFSYAVTAGSLPTGLSLNAGTGAITGSPSASGLFYFTITVTSGGETDAKTYAVHISNNAPGGFNLWTLNTAPTTAIPSAAVITALEDALARWEQHITGDLPDVTYGPNEWSGGRCAGHDVKLNGQSVDDMVIMLSMESIDGPGSTLGSAGPCVVRVAGTLTNTEFGRLRLDTSDLNSLTTHQAFMVAFHEIGHIIGIGTLWTMGTLNEGSGLDDLITCNDCGDPRYLGDDGNAQYYTLKGSSAADIPIEADGGGGTAYGHWDEGEFDIESMTGYIEGSPTTMPISAMTIAAVGDLAYTVNTAGADAYSIPGCAPGCSAGAQPPGAPPAFQLDFGDDLLKEPITLRFPDGTHRVVVPHYAKELH